MQALQPARSRSVASPPKRSKQACSAATWSQQVGGGRQWRAQGGALPIEQRLTGLAHGVGGARRSSGHQGAHRIMIFSCRALVFVSCRPHLAPFGHWPLRPRAVPRPVGPSGQRVLRWPRSPDGAEPLAALLGPSSSLKLRGSRVMAAPIKPASRAPGAPKPALVLSAERRRGAVGAAGPCRRRGRAALWRPRCAPTSLTTASWTTWLKLEARCRSARAAMSSPARRCSSTWNALRAGSSAPATSSAPPAAQAKPRASASRAEHRIAVRVRQLQQLPGGWRAGAGLADHRAQHAHRHRCQRGHAGRRQAALPGRDHPGRAGMSFPLGSPAQVRPAAAQSVLRQPQRLRVRPAVATGTSRRSATPLPRPS